MRVAIDQVQALYVYVSRHGAMNGHEWAIMVDYT